MKERVLLNGGHHNIEITAKWIMDNSKTNTIYIYLSLFHQLTESGYCEIHKLHENKQLFTIDFENPKADFTIEDIIVKCYPYANMHIIDPVKIKRILPGYEKIPGARVMVGLSRDSYKDIYELIDLAIAQELNIDRLVYMDFRIWLNLFSEANQIKYNKRGEDFIKLISSTCEKYEDSNKRKYNISSRDFAINKPCGVNEAVIKKYISNRNLKISIIELLPEQQMKFELLAVDLDGTIIDNEYKISPGMVDFIMSIKDKIKVCIVTGRSVSDTMRYYRELELSTPVICNNGGYIWNPQNQKVVFSQPIVNSRNILDLLFSDVMQNKIQNIIISSGEKTYYLNTTNKYMCQMMIDSHLPKKIIKKSFNRDIDVHRIIISVNQEYKEEIICKIKNISENKVEIFSWRNHEEIIDISIGNVDKWNAITQICKLLEVDEKRIISIGDGVNDIQMLRNSSVGICMKNAKPEVRDMVSLISEYDNNNDGALFSLKKYLC